MLLLLGLFECNLSQKRRLFACKLPSMLNLSGEEAEFALALIRLFLHTSSICKLRYLAGMEEKKEVGEDTRSARVFISSGE